MVGKNIIQMREEIDFLNDRVRHLRFTDTDYVNAINQSSKQNYEDRVLNIKVKKDYSFDSVQKVRDELYTLIREKNISSNPLITTNIIPWPADYDTFLEAQTVIGGYTAKPRFWKFGERLENDPWRKFSAKKPYLREEQTGIKIDHRSTSTITAYSLFYLKRPAVVSFGKESDKISAGATALSVGGIYTCYEPSTHAGVDYNAGDTFTSTSAVLTEGKVILFSKLTNSDFPEKIQQDVIRQAASILSGIAEKQVKKQLIEFDANKS